MNSLSSYRLGDLIFLSLTNEEKQELLNDYPNSIGASYIRKLSENHFLNKMQLICSIIDKELQKKIIPDEIKNSTIIHLRLGDVVAGYESHELIKRPISINELKEVVPLNDKIYIIGKCFFAKTSSKNYQECIQKSNEYLNEVISNFNGTYLDLGNADIDLLAGISCKTFIQGKGYFSKLITEIRKKLNKPSIELYKLSPYVINDQFVYF
jgi:hypothetical protein